MLHEHQIQRPIRAGAIGALSVLLAFGVGCKAKKGGEEAAAVQQTQTTPAPAPQPDNQQLQSAVQAKIASESALDGQNIQVSVSNGVVTLNGEARDAASRALAAADSGSVAGVRTVINNLTSAAPANVTKAQPAPKPTPRAREARRPYREAAPETSRQMAQETPPTPPTPPVAPPERVQTVEPPPPPPPPVAKTVTISAGTVIPVRMTDSLDSATTQSNTVFHGSLAADLIVDGMIAAPRGASVIGRVVSAKDAGHFSGNSELTLELTKLYAGSQEISVVTDQYSKEGAGRGKNTAVKGGVGAAIGGLIGALAGGGEGAAIGAAAGGGIGAGSNGVTRGQQVQIPSEAIVNFRLQSPVSVRTSRVAHGRPAYSPGAGPQLRNSSPSDQFGQPNQ
jgi:hypothetical protein